MLPRVPCFVALIAALAPLGCDPAPAQPAPNVGEIRKAPPKSRRGLVLGRAMIQARPSEEEPVVDEDPDPEAKRQFEQRLAEPAAPLAEASAPPRVTEIALGDTARGEAPGMRPLAPITAAKLAEGKRAMMPVTLAPGECATFIAQGGLGVIELDLFLVRADKSDGLHILAQDQGVGPIAVIGGHGRCYKNPLDTALPAELHATVRRGAGVVLVRGYKK